MKIAQNAKLPAYFITAGCQAVLQGGPEKWEHGVFFITNHIFRS